MIEFQREMNESNRNLGISVNINISLGSYLRNGNDFTTSRERVSDLYLFSSWYVQYHGYLASVVCFLGVIANVLNVIVLTRKTMQSPTNVILTALAISDGLTMAAYFPFAIYIYCMVHSKNLSTAQYVMFHAIFSVLVHSVSIWLTVTLAFFRYLFIKYPHKGLVYCSFKRAYLSVSLCVVAVIIVCLPNCLRYEISQYRENNITTWMMVPKNNSNTDEVIAKVNFWAQGVLIKLLPCIFLTVLSALLVDTMKKAEKRHKNLLLKSNNSEEDKSRERSTNRTTRMLLAVVILFLITETPQGILHVLNGTIEGFMVKVYMPLGDILDIIVLLNNGINFVLYCTMSKQFRDTFVLLFCSFQPIYRSYHVNSHANTASTAV